MNHLAVTDLIPIPSAGQIIDGIATSTGPFIATFFPFVLFMVGVLLVGSVVGWILSKFNR